MNIRKFDKALNQAVAECDDCTPRQRLRFRLALIARPAIRREVRAFVKEQAELDIAEGVFGQGEKIGDWLDNFEKLLQLVIKYLPQILELVLPLFMDTPEVE